jgi:hypothetical protein
MTIFKVGDKVITKTGHESLLMTFGVYDGVTYVINKILTDQAFTPNIDFLCLDGIYACLNSTFFIHADRKTMMFTLDAVDDV